MKRNFLILGASRYQVPAIEAARRLGWRVITADNVPGNPGHVLADQAFHVDTTDRAGILELARREQVAGVLASCTDVAVPTAAYVSEQLGLSGPPLASAEVCCDKARFRQWMNEQGLPAPAWMEVGPETLWNSDQWAGRRWILKPARSSGSKGVRVVENARDWKAFLPEAARMSLNGRALLEEYISGRHGTAEGLILDGRVAFCVVTKRLTAPPPYGATWGHEIPGGWSADEEQSVRAMVNTLAEKLGLRDALFDADFITADGQVWLLEFSPRQGGNSLNRLLEASHGIRMVEWAVQLATGDRPEPVAADHLRAAAVRLLGVERDGRLCYDQRAVTWLRQQPWMFHLEMDHAPGTGVRAFADGTCRLGEMVVTGKDIEDVLQHVEEARRQLCLEVEDV